MAALDGEAKRDTDQYGRTLMDRVGRRLAGRRLETTPTFADSLTR